MTVTLEPSVAKPPTAPGLLDLEITRRRQLTCRSHCYAEAGPTQGHGTMTTDEWKRVISEAAAIGTERIQLIGGEPTLHPDFAELVEHADRLTGRRFTDRITVIPWGTPLSDARVRDQPPTGTGPPSLVHAGRLDDNKSTITAIEALALTDQPHHLTVIGKGPLREHLEKRAIDLGLRGRVNFDPFLPRTELWRAALPVRPRDAW
ncbi:MULTISPECIES: radical SAM protein [unclassified Streptomyces]|uniref:radical SAM protein n=1 Tax=unclassified Streptomyces TaxID=2593676 RepID=UPI000DC56B81|nr:radical SAM protein [Streptomyces sp. PsTaAH-130]RAJ48694.1 glycosyl transferase family 1 [Streptomyces sp. PsTaAH-130]